MRSPIFLFFIEIVFFIGFGAILLEHSSLLSDTSHFYSTALAHRLQTDALLNGHLSLSPQPYGYQLDYYWSGHGLQQPWGLGVPFLRLPFEWISLHLGQGPFADRLTLLFYVFLTMIILNMAFRVVLAESGAGPRTPTGFLLRWYFIAWIVFSQAWGVLIQKQINIDRVYCETVLYDCLYIYWLLALFWTNIINPKARTFLFLCLLSGLAWLIRPTMIAYGLLLMFLAGLYSYKEKRDLKLIMTGLFCFAIGVAINLGCNKLRFGSMFEFGQSQNFGDNAVFDYSTRFGYPFQHEPWLRAAKELIGALFFNNMWQSPAVRFRWGLSGYEAPFNPVHLMIIAAAAVAVFYNFGKKYREKSKIVYPTLIAGLTCCVLFFGFYLKTPYINNRYLAEFSPAINALYIALILSILPRPRGPSPAAIFLISLMGVFFLANRTFFNHVSEEAIPQSRIPVVGACRLTDQQGIKEMTDRAGQELLLRPQLPLESYCGHLYPAPGLAYQYDGWDITKSCLVSPVTSAILPLRKCVSLNYTAGDGLPQVRVKRDLTFLKPGPQRSLGTTVTRIFCTDAPGAGDVAMYSIGWIPPDQLNYRHLHIRLNSIKLTDGRQAF